MISTFNSNFYCQGVHQLARNVSRNCCHCNLNKLRKKMAIKGTKRQYQDNEEPGRVYQADILHLPKSSLGYQYALTLVNRLTAYGCAVPLRSINNQTIIQSLRNILSILPPMKTIATDLGSLDFGSDVTRELARLGISHEGSLSNRSQQQGSIEIFNKLLTAQLARICSSTHGKKSWPEALPLAISALNSHNPYNCHFSRRQLLFSPFIYGDAGGTLNLNNPVRSIASTYKHLNQKRMAGMMKSKGNPKKKIWHPGQYCLLNHNPSGINIGEAKGKIGVPHQPQVYKILSADKDNFSYKVLNLQTGSIR